ncbi:MAG: hemolysin III family protein [Clostridia bacterium]|nr:hemolysin III family protein [Clostridia bacterium]
MTNVSNYNGQSQKEEIANTITHGIGVLLAVAGSAVMVTLAFLNQNSINIVSSFIYGLSLIALYASSTIYHFLSSEKKRVFQKIDHCSIFILIVGSYAPLCLALLGGQLGWALFAVNIACAIGGITVNLIDIKKWHKLSLALYLVMGWSCIFVIIPLMQKLSFGGAALLVSGGLCYSLGVIFYLNKKRLYMHSVWHLFVIAGSAFHYFFTLFYIILS